MIGWFSIHRSLTNAEIRQAAFLTLTLFLVLASRLSLADPLPAIEAAQENADKIRTSEVTSYIRQQALHGASMLPSEARQVMGWFSGNWRAVNVSGDDDDAMPTTGGQGLTQSTPDDSSIGLTSNFHHKGFLPTHDAMMIGAAYKQNILDDKLQLTARPFIGQSWHSLRDYWGSEVSLNIAQHPDGLPWGQISMGYIGGNESMTDHGRGIDLHGDVDLTNGFKFVSGMRQNSDLGDSNYVMVKWKLDFN